MSMASDSSPEDVIPGRLTLPALVVSRFALQPSTLLVSLLLIDIGDTFGLPIGIVGQLRTTASIVGVVSALLMGVLSVRYRHKTLLMVGLLVLAVSSIGCSLSVNFAMMLLFNSLAGLSTVIVAPMTVSLVAEHLPMERRSGAIGWVIAGQSLAYLVGAPLIGFLAGYGGWRTPFIAFVLPSALMALLLSQWGLSAGRLPQHSAEGRSFSGGFKAVLTSRSAVVCLLCFVLSMVGFQAVLLYAASFLRQTFMLSTGVVSLLILGSAIFYTLGSLGSGRLVSRLGRKRTVVLVNLLSSVSVIAFTNLTSFLPVMLCYYLCALFSGAGFAAFQSLIVEQVPEYRGTVMSLTSAANSLGTALGAAIGGVILLNFSFGALGAVLGAVGLVSMGILHQLGSDPTRVHGNA
jgi:DHA1 family inner membrane transport protein